jgi:hypothetical protein
MSRPRNLHPDANEIAFRTVQAATGEIAKPLPAGEQGNEEAAARGRKGGQKGGRARAQKLTKKRKAEIARRAAQARWKKSPE